MVEDNAFNMELATILLRQKKLAVLQAETGREALHILENNPVDCVLMDMQMPVMDGCTACRVIRSSGRLHNLPVIAMTANVMRTDIEKCRAAGMNDHIGKPLNEKELFQTLTRWLTRGNGNSGPEAIPDSAETPPV